MHTQSAWLRAQRVHPRLLFSLRCCCTHPDSKTVCFRVSPRLIADPNGLLCSIRKATINTRAAAGWGAPALLIIRHHTRRPSSAQVANINKPPSKACSHAHAWPPCTRMHTHAISSTRRAKLNAPRSAELTAREWRWLPRRQSAPPWQQTRAPLPATAACYPAR